MCLSAPRRPRPPASTGGRRSSVAAATGEMRSGRLARHEGKGEGHRNRGRSLPPVDFLVRHNAAVTPAEVL